MEVEIMSTEEVRDIREILHEEFAAYDKSIWDKIKSQREPPLVKYWPVLVVAAGCLIGFVRLEERFEAHLNTPWHQGMEKTNEQLVEINAELKHLRDVLNDLQKKMNQ